MKKISISEIVNEKNVTQEEMAQVKGGPHFRNFHSTVINASAANNLTLKRG